MKLLVDESLAGRVAALLADAGHDVIHVGDRELLGAPDEMVLATAQREARVVVTADTDFGTCWLSARLHSQASSCCAGQDDEPSSAHAPSSM